MNYRQVGEWQISEIGFGCYGLSGAYGQVDPQAFKKMIHQAFEGGVNFFDTAEGYGDAEGVLGEGVAPFREQVYLATKVSGESGTSDLSTQAVRDACEASLQRLNTDVIDLYQVHFDDSKTTVLETVAALEALVDEGKIRAYGVCHLPIDRVEEYAADGNLFSVLMELSPVATKSAQTLLPVCQQHNLAAIAFSVTGRGILSGQYPVDHTFESEDIRRMDPLFKRERFESALRVRNYLAALGERYGRSALQMGIAWVLAQPQVVCALTGTSSSDHLAENLAASAIKLDQECLDDLDRFLESEGARLAIAQGETIRLLVSEPLADDPEQAFNDLVYLMETAVNIGKVREAEMMAPFLELFALRKSLDQNAHRKMRGIQLVLRELMPFSGANTNTMQ